MNDRKREPSSPLSEEEQDVVEETASLSSPVIYEVIRQEGEVELQRPLVSLWWSGIAAGIAISSSLLAQALLVEYLPDAPWQPAVASLGYCVGFLIVIMGRLQLFTEDTLTAVLPLLAHWSRSTVAQTARLWALVFAANLVGTLITATITTYVDIVAASHVDAILRVSQKLVELTAMESLLRGIPAGFFVAVIVWLLPNARGSEFWVILVITYLIALGGFTHVIVASAEVFMLILNDAISVWHGLFGLLAPTLIGNIIGGTGLFALLAYGQIREELH